MQRRSTRHSKPHVAEIVGGGEEPASKDGPRPPSPVDDEVDEQHEDGESELHMAELYI